MQPVVGEGFAQYGQTHTRMPPAVALRRLAMAPSAATTPLASPSPSGCLMLHNASLALKDPFHMPVLLPQLLPCPRSPAAQI
jgi:hypothetical protein